MDILTKFQEICKMFDIWPTRTKGQNFLINEKIYDKIIEASNLSKDDLVLEVGPGLGVLTAKLANVAGHVVAVELDDKIAAYLKELVADSTSKNIEIINENVLDFEISPSFPKFKTRNAKYKIVANLPYNISSVFLRKFLTSKHRPEEMVLMLQKEVAERICAKAGDMSLLALSVQFYAKPEIVLQVSKKDFWPEPQVNSAVIRIKLKKEADIDEENEKAIFRLAKFGFSSKRKMLKNNLGGGLHIKPAEAELILVEAGLNPKARAEDLSIEDWLKLTKIVK